MIQDESTKIILVIIAFIGASVATIGWLTVVASLANVNPLLGILFLMWIIVVDFSALRFILSYLK